MHKTAIIEIGDVGRRRRRRGLCPLRPLPVLLQWWVIHHWRHVLL